MVQEYTWLMSNTINNRTKAKSSREIYWNEDQVYKREFPLNGFSHQGIGGLRTLKSIEFGEFLNLSFLLFMTDEISDKAAILDLDLDYVGNPKDFVSILSGGDCLSTIYTNGKIKTVSYAPKIKNIKNKWIKIDVFLKQDSVVIKTSNEISNYFEFDKNITVTRIAFGNNDYQHRFEKENDVNFLIKDITVETEHFKSI